MSEEKRPEWMTSISATVDPQDYLLGRKIDKTFELSQKEKAEHEKKVRIDLIASDKLRLTGDPILDLERRKQALKYEIITNPIKRKQMRDFLLKREKGAQRSSRYAANEAKSAERTERLSKIKTVSSPRRKRHSRSPSHRIELQHDCHRESKSRHHKSSSHHRERSDHTSKHDRGEGHHDRHHRSSEHSSRHDRHNSPKGSSSDYRGYRNTSPRRSYESSTRRHSHR